MKIKFNNLLIVALCGVLLVSCQKQDTNQLDKDKTVDVALSIGFDDEADAYDLMQSTRGGETDGDAGFDFNLVPSAKTRANSTVPDKLYNLEVRQYDANGGYLGGKLFSAEEALGSKLTIPMVAKTNSQLVIVVWGGNTDVSKTFLGTKTLSQAMDMVFPADYIKNISTNSTDMKGMPYVQHLKNVNIVADGSNGIIQSGNGEIDARIRLKRLASLITVKWDYKVDNYEIKQILLQGVPMDFKLVANPDAITGTYPSLIDQFTTIQLSDTEIKAKSYSRWVPANVRGNSATANSIINRYKDTAPRGSSFINFIASNTNGKEGDKNKKLDYRVYLGGTSSMNFDVLPNTNYNYDVTFSHVGIPVNDKRVKYLDPIPASQNNNSFVPTANCFIVAPGGSFNFNPLKFSVGNVANSIDNPYLKSTNSIYMGEIKSVRLLWQVKEDGDVGDPTIGVVNSNTDHSNIVEYKDGRIYCRVAPNTLGGSGVIAAYDGLNGSGNIVWSWHVWVTDYAPSATQTTTVLTPENMRVHKYGSTAKLFMDRNLGAVKGFMAMPADGLDASKSNGFHYQRARKDPFPSSYTTKETLSNQSSGNSYIFTIEDGVPPLHVLNRYGADGLSLILPKTVGLSPLTLKEVYRNPIQITVRSGYSSNDWGTENPSVRGDWGTNKTAHDPCPIGWRVPTETEVTPLATSVAASSSGGRLVKFDNSNSAFFRYTGYPPSAGQLNFVGQRGYLMTSTRYNGGAVGRVLIISSSGMVASNLDSYDGHTLRCIQE